MSLLLCVKQSIFHAKSYQQFLTLSTLCITLLMSSFLLCRVSALADRDNILKTDNSANFEEITASITVSFQNSV